MCFWGDDDATLARFAVRKARKRHVCAECDEPIAVGDVYRHCRWLYDGSWSSMAVCARCEFVREMIAQVERAEGCEDYEARPLYGELREAWEGDPEYAEALGLAVVRDDEIEVPSLNELPRGFAAPEPEPAARRGR